MKFIDNYIMHDLDEGLEKFSDDEIFRFPLFPYFYGAVVLINLFSFWKTTLNYSISGLPQIIGRHIFTKRFNIKYSSKDFQFKKGPKKLRGSSNNSQMSMLLV